MSLLSLDSRWRRFNDTTRACPCCGQSFDGIFDIGFDHPDMWSHASRDDQPFVRQGDDQLTSDLCRIGEDRFIRCILPLPLVGSDEVFHFGVWGSVTAERIQDYIAASEDHDPTRFAAGFSWLCNELPLFASEDPIACDMLPDPDPQTRPRLMAQAGPLAAAQANGISFDQLLDIYAACGTDVRPHLTAS